MLKKNEIPVTPFQNNHTFWRERQRPLHSNFIILRTEANQNVHGTDIESKELKRQNPY
jgi:hypothetical protein